MRGTGAAFLLFRPGGWPPVLYWTLPRIRTGPGRHPWRTMDQRSQRSRSTPGFELIERPAVSAWDSGRSWCGPRAGSVRRSWSAESRSRYLLLQIASRSRCRLPAMSSDIWPGRRWSRFRCCSSLGGRRRSRSGRPARSSARWTGGWPIRCCRSPTGSSAIELSSRGRAACRRRRVALELVEVATRARLVTGASAFTAGGPSRSPKGQAAAAGPNRSPATTPRCGRADRRR